VGVKSDLAGEGKGDHRRNEKGRKGELCLGERGSLFGMFEEKQSLVSKKGDDLKLKTVDLLRPKRLIWVGEEKRGRRDKKVEMGLLKGKRESSILGISGGP